MNKSRGVVIFGSVLAALQFLAAATALTDIIGKTTFGLFVIAVGAVQVGWAAFQQSQVVPFADTGAFINSQGQLVAGPASGVTNGKTVEVIKTEYPASEGEMILGSHRAPNEYGHVSIERALVVAACIVVIVVGLVWLL
jgi:hypothetical protein